MTATVRPAGPAGSASADTPAEAVPTAPLDLLIIGLHYAPEPSGNAPYTSGLAQGLRRVGHQVRVITAFPHYPQWRIADGYEGRRISERVRDVPVLRLRPWLPRRQRLLDRLLMETSFGARVSLTGWGRPADVLLVSPALFTTALAAVAARLRRVPVTIWVQDIYSLGVAQTGHSGPAQRLIRLFERRVLGMAASIVVIHDRFERYLVAELGLPADRIEVVRNWTHLEEPAVTDRAGTRRRLGWGDDEVIVLHAGNMGAKQGLENVVDAAALAGDQGSRVRFVLLGDGNQRVALEQRLSGLAQDRPRSPRLTFVDPVPDEEFIEVLHAADILLVNERPGLTEMSVPSKLTSYFSTGLPVLACTDASSVTADEMASAGAGVRVDAADPVALVAAAESLAADPVAAREYGRAGRVYREERLTEPAAIAAFERVFANRAGRRRRGPFRPL